MMLPARPWAVLTRAAAGGAAVDQCLNYGGSDAAAGTGDQGNLACRVAAHQRAPVVMQGRHAGSFLAGVEGFSRDDVS
jgi:hypothetical protein